MRSRQGEPVRKVREGLGEPGGVIHLEQDVRDPRVWHPPVEVGDQVSGSRPARRLPSFRRGACCLRCCRQQITRARAAAASRRRPFVQREPALGEPVVRTGRDRQAAVGISDGGSRQQRLSDIAVAPRPRQPAPPWRRCAGRRRLPATASLRATPRCPACAAFAACSGGSGCNLPTRGSTGPTRPCSRARPPLRDKVSETLPSGTVRDHRVERLAGIPRADPAPSPVRRTPGAPRGPSAVLVPELPFAGTRGFAIRSADDPVVGLHDGDGRGVAGDPSRRCASRRRAGRRWSMRRGGRAPRPVRGVRSATRRPRGRAWRPGPACGG